MPVLQAKINSYEYFFGFFKEVELTLKHCNNFTITISDLMNKDHNIWIDALNIKGFKISLGRSSEADFLLSLHNNGVCIVFSSLYIKGQDNILEMEYSIPYSECEQAFKEISFFLNPKGDKKD